MTPPEPYRRYGSAWWRVHHFLYLFRLNANVTAAVVDFMRTSAVLPVADSTSAGVGSDVGSGSGGHNNRATYLSWHVRHGDKVVEKHATFEANEFLPALDRVVASAPSSGEGGSGRTGSALPPVTNVFLASDDPAVTDQAPGLLKSKYSVYSLLDRMKLGDSAAKESAFLARNDASSAYVLAVEAIANIWMMSEGSYFVGALSTAALYQHLSVHALI